MLLNYFSWNVLLHPFTLSWCLFLMSSCIYWKQQKDGPCFLVNAVSMYLFIGEIETINIERYQWTLLLIPVDCYCYCWCCSGGSNCVCICVCSPLDFWFSFLRLLIFFPVFLNIFNLYIGHFSSIAFYSGGFVDKYCLNFSMKCVLFSPTVVIESLLGIVFWVGIFGLLKFYNSWLALLAFKSPLRNILFNRSAFICY